MFRLSALKQNLRQTLCQNRFLSGAPEAFKSALSINTGTPPKEPGNVKLSQKKNSASIETIYDGLINSDRSCLSRAITLVESTKQDHRKQADLILERLLEKQNNRIASRRRNSFRIALSGSPGAGKSTLIEAFGCLLLEKGHKVAVLAIDPSSKRTGGSILGDKTRMDLLSRNKNAFVRPSPSRGALGGVCRKTNEAVLLCESAGYDIIIIETVGVGQSETMVSEMVDIFGLVVPPASGDDLQGIKRGIIELSDIILINKCDGDLMPAARRAKTDMQGAIKLMRPISTYWKTEVLQLSAKTGLGLEELWAQMEKFRTIMIENGEFEKKRKSQRKTHLWNCLTDRVMDRLLRDRDVKSSLEDIESRVINGKITPEKGAEVLLSAFLKNRDF